MKVDVIRKEVKLKEYPILKIGCMSGTIVLFTESKTGTMISCGSQDWYKVGHYSTTWYEDRFIEFTGEVKLRN